MYTPADMFFVDMMRVWQVSFCRRALSPCCIVALYDAPAQRSVERLAELYNSNESRMRCRSMLSAEHVAWAVEVGLGRGQRDSLCGLKLAGLCFDVLFKVLRSAVVV